MARARPVARAGGFSHASHRSPERSFPHGMQLGARVVGLPRGRVHLRGEDLHVHRGGHLHQLWLLGRELLVPLPRRQYLHRHLRPILQRGLQGRQPMHVPGGREREPFVRGLHLLHHRRQERLGLLRLQGGLPRRVHRVLLGLVQRLHLRPPMPRRFRPPQRGGLCRVPMKRQTGARAAHERGPQGRALVPAGDRLASRRRRMGAAMSAPPKATSDKTRVAGRPWGTSSISTFSALSPSSG